MHHTKTLRIRQIQVAPSMQDNASHTLYGVDQFGKVWRKQIGPQEEGIWQMLDMSFEGQSVPAMHGLLTAIE